MNRHGNRPSAAAKTNIHPLGTEPLHLKSGSVEVRIYPTWNRLYRKDAETGERRLIAEHPQFTLAYYVGKKRTLKKFASLDAAKDEANRALIKLSNSDSAALQLSGRERHIYVEARKALDKADPGMNLDAAMLDYAAARKALEPFGVSLTEAVREYVERHKSIRESRTIPDLWKEFCDVKTKAGKSERYLGDLKRLRKFTEAFPGPVQEITAPPLQQFLDQLGSPRTQWNHWRLIRSLLHFAVRRKYASRDLLGEIEGVELPEIPKADTEIYTPDELREMLDACRPELVPWLAIAAFSGLRMAEILRLDWSDVNLERQHVIVKARKAKTGSRRVVPLCDAAVAWLLPHADTTGRVAYYSEENKFTAAVTESVNTARTEAGREANFRWKANALRHSFCSYRVAEKKNVNEVALEAGNSAAMIFRHYHEIVSPEDAKRWFETAPTSDRSNVIPMKQAAAA